jgi:hypothetical protein
MSLRIAFERAWSRANSDRHTATGALKRIHNLILQLDTIAAQPSNGHTNSIARASITPSVRRSHGLKRSDFHSSPPWTSLLRDIRLMNITHMIYHLVLPWKAVPTRPTATWPLTVVERGNDSDVHAVYMALQISLSTAGMSAVLVKAVIALAGRCQST